MKGFVYILKSEKNGRYYVGSTNNLNRRIKEHNTGQQKATRYIVPLKLVYMEEFDTILAARRRELKIKSWKSKKEIEKLINMGL
ncbi:MAG: GIY-YIG nuclease family protein [Candidatus Gracilibacteria bacterium]